MELTEQQIEFIRADIREKGVTLNSLADDIVDHICCFLEAHDGTEFKTAYEEAIRMFGEGGLIRIQETTLSLTLKPTENMKKTMYVTGFIATCLTTTGLLFKIQHWQGASVMLVLGIALLNLAFLPMFFYDRYRKSVAG